MNSNYEVKLFDYLITEVFSAGGDGDVTVVCKRNGYKELAEKFYQYLILKYPDYHYDKHDDYIIISDRTNESWTFTSRPDIVLSYSQCTIYLNYV